MHKLVEYAIDAANHGDKNKAMVFLKQALTANPKDTEAMLVLAGLVDEPDRKRQVLNRLLTVNPANLLARDELLKLDRQDMGAFRAEIAMPTLYPPAAVSSQITSQKIAEQPALPKPPAQVASVLHPTTQPVRVKNLFDHWVVESPTVKPRVAVELDGYSIIEKPLVFKYPPFWRILIYFFAAFFACVGLMVALQNVVNSLPFLALAALMGILALAFSPLVEVSEAGIRAFGMFSSAEIRWEEIDTIRSLPTKRRLQLSGTTGKPVHVSTQVSGYPRIVEIIRQRRPDLFGGIPLEQPRGTPFAVRYGSLESESGFTGTKTFRKNFFTQYAMSFLLIPVCVLLAWSLFTEPQYRVWAFLVGGCCAILMILPFFQPGVIRLEANKLIAESFFRQKELTAKQIREISMKTVRSRRGAATNFVHIQPLEGTAIALAGFAEGDEILYGTLVNWWEFYQDE